MLAGLCRQLTATIDVLLPPACFYCGNNLASHNDLHLCNACDDAIIALPSGHCLCCTDPFPGSASTHLCQSCLRAPPPFTKVYAGCRFQGPAKEMIHALKYRNQVRLAKPLGLMINRESKKAINDYRADCIIPVPLHPKRLRQRSYNQALELAREVSRHSGLPIKPQTLIRHRHTQQMFGLTVAERARNLRHAFSTRDVVRRMKILLIDDVMTTGETARACALTLIQAGASEVRVAVAARA